MKKILNKLNQAASRLPAPIAKLLGIKIPKPIFYILMIPVLYYGIALVLGVLGIAFIFLLDSDLLDFFYMDYPFYTIANWLTLLGLAYVFVLVWYWRSKNRNPKRLLTTALFLLYIVLVISFWCEVKQALYFSDQLKWIPDQSPDELMAWQMEREILAIDNIEVYVRAIYKTVAVTAVMVVSWLFFRRS